MNQKIIQGMKYSEDKPVSSPVEDNFSFITDDEKPGFLQRAFNYPLGMLRLVFNSFTYHSKMILFMTFDLITNMIFKRRIPS